MAVNSPTPHATVPPWTPEAYVKIIDVDMNMLLDTVNDLHRGLMDKLTSRYAASEALRYSGKIQDNLKLLVQSLTREIQEEERQDKMPFIKP